MEDPERAASALAELREMGIRIAVDDFGTGYSSLSHLQRFPVDILKIDKSFIDPLTSHDTGSSALVTAIIGLAQSLGSRSSPRASSTRASSTGWWSSVVHRARAFSWPDPSTEMPQSPSSPSSPAWPPPNPPIYTGAGGDWARHPGEP